MAFLLTAMALKSKGQDIPDKVFLDSADFNYSFYTTDHHPSVKTGRVYTWYKTGRILTTQEGYDGKLLNGCFRKVYTNKNLCESGQYKNGIKSGLWMEWYPAGVLMEKSHWGNGYRKGSVERYDSIGRLTEKGYYSDQAFTGVVYQRIGADSTRSIQYAGGKAVIKSPPPKNK